MTDDEKINLINTCVKEAKLHADHPSSETKKFMDEVSRKIEANCITIEVMKNQLSNVEKSNTIEHQEIKESINEMKSNQKEYMGSMDRFIKSADDRFADKKDHLETTNQISDLSSIITNNYVTKEAFKPIQKLAYGLVGAVLLAVLGAIMALLLEIKWEN